jgi:hypothetical protein
MPADGLLLTNHAQAAAKHQENARQDNKEAAAPAARIGAVGAARAGVSEEIAAAEERS